LPQITTQVAPDLSASLSYHAYCRVNALLGICLIGIRFRKVLTAKKIVVFDKHIRSRDGRLAMIEVGPVSLLAVTRRMTGAAAMRRLAQHQEGAAAVEFGLVATPFLALIFAIIETALVFFAGQVLETAAADSARLIMTGQAQTGGFDENKFKEEVCARIVGLFDCYNGIYVDVKSYSSFGSVNITKPIDENGNLKIDDFAYQPGGAGDIVVVRLVYQWPILVPLLGINLADMTGNKRLLMATVAFRNEPYQ
jgi:Flp pilus assembly protein TadG